MEKFCQKRVDEIVVNTTSDQYMLVVSRFVLRNSFQHSDVVKRNYPKNFFCSLLA